MFIALGLPFPPVHLSVGGGGGGGGAQQEFPQVLLVHIITVVCSSHPEIIGEGGALWVKMCT